MSNYTERFREILNEYREGLEKDRKNRKPLSGIFGFGAGPGDDPCHGILDRQAEQLMTELGTEEPAPEETAELVNAVFRAEGSEGAYDLCVAADILEHLVQPEIELSKLKIPLKKDGLLLVSLPNVANAYVRLNLLLGRFPYYRKGILDATHLHFYTLKSMRRMLERTGWVVKKRWVSSIPIAIVFPFLRNRCFRWVTWLVHLLTACFPGLLGYQGVFACRNPNTGELL